MVETWKVIKKTQNEFNWFIRLHPAMVKDLNMIMKKLKAMGVYHYEISETSSLPLQTILRNVNAHITCQSSCIIEAADFGVLSIITSEYGQALYKDVINSKNAFYIHKEDDIINGLYQIITQKKLLSNDSNVINSKNKAIEELIEKYFV
jgi:hypothetical protein